MAAHTLSKRERLCSMKLTDQLFGRAGNHSMAVFPLRVVWMEMERKENDVPIQMLVSVSKRHFKHAVKRNRVKRQLREAYRLSKQPLIEKLEHAPERAVAMGFVWLTDELYSSAEVSDRMKRLIQRICEKL